MCKQRTIMIMKTCAHFILVLGMIASMAWAAEELPTDEVTELDDIVITGTKTEKKLTDVPVRTELIKRKEIEETASRTLADAIEFIPGLRVENNCQNCNFSQLRMLGLEGAYSQILIDGQPLMSSVAAVYGIEHIPARMIDRIEIVKGGGSALYGPGAIAGIVNVISRDPSISGGDIELTYEGIDGEASTSLSAVGDFVSENGQTRVSILGQTDTRDGYDRDGDGFTELGERDMDSIGIRIRQFINDKSDLTLSYTHTYEDRRGGDSLDLPEFMAEIAEAVVTTRDAGNISWSHAPSQSFDYRITGAMALTDRDTYYGAGMDENAYGNSESPLYILDTQFNHYCGDHTVTWGGQYSFEGLEDTQPAYDRVTDDEYKNTGFYVQDDWGFTDSLNLVIGGRVDKHSEIDDAILSPRLAAKWAPCDDLDIRASYSTGFRAPQVFDEDLHITQAGGEGQVIRNDPNLKEEKSSGYTLGAQWTPRVGSGFVLVEATAFYTDIEDSFSLDEQDDPATDEVEFVRINRGGSKVSGVEINFGYQIGNKFEAQIGYVHQDSEFDDPDDDFGSKDFFRTPDDYAIMKISWRNPELVDVFVGAKYTGEMKVPHYAGFIAVDRLETSETFLTWDVSIAKGFDVGDNTLSVTAGCKNLTDEYQDDVDQGPDRDAGYVYGPRFPRTVYATLKYEF